MTWIDGTSWNPTRGRQLVKLLAQVYDSEEAVRKVLDDSGIGCGYLPAPMQLQLLWHELAYSLHSARMLGVLLAVMAQDFPRLENRLAELSADDPAVAAGNPADTYQVRLLGPGRRPLIDRADLRDNLRRFLDQRLPVLVVRGANRSGKSFSFELMKHVAGGLDDPRLIQVDFSPVASGSTATALMAMLCSRLGLRDVTGGTRRTTRTRYAGELVDDLVGAYRFKDRAIRIIVIDGLNRADLDNDVHDLVVKLAVEVVNAQLPRTQLVLTGYGGAFDRQLTYDLLTEDIAPITETHVRLFFEGLELGRTLTRAELDDLVREAMAGGGELEDLGDRVRRLSLPLLDAR